MKIQSANVQLFLITSLFAGLAQASEGAFETNTVYGEDSRQDLYEITDKRVLKFASSTVALFDKKNAIDQGDGTVKLTSNVYAKDESLCEGEKFVGQNTAAWCSGSLIAPNVVLTAGHCVKTEADCADVAFAFNYAVDSADRVAEKIAKKEIYGCKKILRHVLENEGADYAVIELDRAVTDRKPLLLSTTRQLAPGSDLLVIGHPSGLPTKVANGKIRSNSNADYYVTTLDTFAGNSGSAVLNPRNGRVEGVLVRGDNDFRYDAARGCNVSYVNPDNGGRGEDVTRLTPAVIKQIRASIREAATAQSSL